MMIVYAEFEFVIPTSHSLKDKRAILQRMMTRTKQKFNVALAEIDHQDVWQRTRIAVVTVSSSKDVAHGEIERIRSFMESNPEWELIDSFIEEL